MGVTVAEDAQAADHDHQYPAIAAAAMPTIGALSAGARRAEEGGVAVLEHAAVTATSQ